MDHKNELDDFEVLVNLEGSQSISEIYLNLKEISDDIPWNELRKRHLIPKGKKISYIAHLLPMIELNRDGNQFFRKTDGSSDISTKLWLAEVKLKAQHLEFEQKIGKHFNSKDIDNNFLTYIAKLSSQVENIKNIKNILEQFGIILIFSPKLPKAKVDGAVGLLTSNAPFIGLSLRHNRLDNFWFTLLHELAHINLHLDQIGIPIIDDLEDEEEAINHIEAAANYYALEAIVPRRIWNRSDPVFDPYITNQGIIEFAQKIGVHPALIAGRLQKEKDRFDKYRKIVDEINVRELIWGER